MKIQPFMTKSKEIFVLFDKEKIDILQKYKLHLIDLMLNYKPEGDKKKEKDFHTNKFLIEIKKVETYIKEIKYE